MVATEAPLGPLVLIGAGRSGTTMFKRIMDAHPEIDFQGETDFLAYRLWKEIYENRFWFEWRRSMGANPQDAFFVLPYLTAREVGDLQKDCGTAVARAFKATLGISGEGVWGYKEIWNGSENYDVPWDPFDFIFPHALWVHLVRHPVSFALSCARWNRDQPDEAYLQQRFSDWVGIVKKSRLRRDSGRFHEIRYEDLSSDTRSTLTPLLERCGLQWHSACASEAQRSTFEAAKEKKRTDKKFTLEMFGAEVPDLINLCTDLEYSTTTPFTLFEVVEKSFASTYDLRSGAIFDYIPLKHFNHRGGLAWFTPLPQLSHLADNADYPDRSVVLLMEDSCVVGPSHAHHDEIRRRGEGAFSHWSDGIYSGIFLSTSDGSNPNVNGRCYFALVPRHHAPRQGVTSP